MMIYMMICRYKNKEEFKLINVIFYNYKCEINYITVPEKISVPSADVIKINDDATLYMINDGFSLLYKNDIFNNEILCGCFKLYLYSFIKNKYGFTKDELKISPFNMSMEDYRKYNDLCSDIIKLKESFNKELLNFNLII